MNDPIPAPYAELRLPESSIQLLLYRRNDDLVISFNDLDRQYGLGRIVVQEFYRYIATRTISLGDFRLSPMER